MSTSTIGNVFALDPLIRARLLEQLPDLRTVGSGEDIVGAQDITELCPAVFVLPSDGEPQARGSALWRETQRWAVLLAVGHHNAADPASSTAFRAGEIMGRILSALHGWCPIPGVAPLAFSGRGIPYFEPGYAELPLYFEVAVSYAIRPSS